MRFLLRLVPLVFLLAGCATAPRTSQVATVPLTPALTDQAATPAYDALAQGDFAKAASLFQSLAARSLPPKKQEYVLGAVEACIDGEQLAQAARLLAYLDTKGISVRDAARARLLEARLALKKRDGNTALAALASPMPAGVEPNFYSEYHLLRGMAFNQNGNYLEAAREYALRDIFLSDPPMQLLNQQAIMEALSKLSEPVLLSLKTPPPPDVFTGWLELARLAKARQTLSSLENALDNWRLRYPGHPVREEILAAMRQHAQQLTEVPSRIAVLLPFTGSLHDAAAAVRDGVLAAYYGSEFRKGIQLRTYDTGPDLSHVGSAYDQAVQDGAEFVIGPLRKEAVEVLARRDNLPVPVLALNTMDSGEAPQGLFQFGLPPEEEAREVAGRAWADGHTRAAVVTPDGPWGERIAQAFREKWTQLGGIVVASATYNPKENDYSAPLRTMLKLDDSARREKQVERLFGRHIEFTPRRRQDVDFIFFAAYPKQARLLRPQISFFQADDLPVYATSQIFSGNVNPDSDGDMNGTVFGDMPWVLEGLQPPALQRYDGELRRLVALGSDAFNVLRYLRLLQQYPDQRFEGVTGTLRLDDHGRIHRQLAWARFVDGRPRLLEIESLNASNPKVR